MDTGQEAATEGAVEVLKAGYRTKRAMLAEGFSAGFGVSLPFTEQVAEAGQLGLFIHRQPPEGGVCPGQRPAFPQE